MINDPKFTGFFQSSYQNNNIFGMESIFPEFPENEEFDIDVFFNDQMTEIFQTAITPSIQNNPTPIALADPENIAKYRISSPVLSENSKQITDIREANTQYFQSTRHEFQPSNFYFPEERESINYYAKQYRTEIPPIAIDNRKRPREESSYNQSLQNAHQYKNEYFSNKRVNKFFQTNKPPSIENNSGPLAMTKMSSRILLKNPDLKLETVYKGSQDKKEIEKLSLELDPDTKQIITDWIVNLCAQNFGDSNIIDQMIDYLYLAKYKYNLTELLDPTLKPHLTTHTFDNEKINLIRNIIKCRLASNTYFKSVMASKEIRSKNSDQILEMAYKGSKDKGEIKKLSLELDRDTKQIITDWITNLYAHNFGFSNIIDKMIDYLYLAKYKYNLTELLDSTLKPYLTTNKLDRDKIRNLRVVLNRRMESPIYFKKQLG